MGGIYDLVVCKLCHNKFILKVGMGIPGPHPGLLNQNFWIYSLRIRIFTSLLGKSPVQVTDFGYNQVLD